MPSEGEAREERVLIFAMFGGDAAHTARILASVGIASDTMPDIAGVCSAIDEGAGALVVTEEALVPQATKELLCTLDRQPPWSDLPIIVSAVDRELVRVGIGLAGSLGRRANVLILERPISVRAMVASVQSALRARRRQYEARAIVSELARARELAEESSRSKDEFLATLSHELRTPLNAILGWTRMLRGNVIAPEKRDRALETIERNGIAQTQLVEDLLDVSRAVTGKARMDVRSMDVVTAINAAVETVRPAAEAKQIDLSMALEPGVGPILGDAGRLQQVLWNVLNNAIKFSQIGGRVRAVLERVESSVRITVTDNGVGIAPEFLPHVFDPFRQADASSKRSYGGLGIGLALVKKFVELHGGSVRASSQGVGHGATFVIEIPLAHAIGVHLPALKVLSTSGRFENNKRLAGLRILVVDDEPDSADLLSNVLEGSGATVLLARAAADGYELLVAQRPDIIVSDIAMAGEDGYDFINRVRSQSLSARVPALALTAYARVEDRSRALRAGFDMHISKPVDPGELIVALEMLAKQFTEIGSDQRTRPDQRVG